MNSNKKEIGCPNILNVSLQYQLTTDLIIGGFFPAFSASSNFGRELDVARVLTGDAYNRKAIDHLN